MLKLGGVALIYCLWWMVVCLIFAMDGDYKMVRYFFCLVVGCIIADCLLHY